MLAKLNDVQKHDLQLDNLKQERKATPPELINLREKQAELNKQHQQKRQEQDELRRQVSKNELELQSLQARRKSAVEASLRASSSKEASQYQNQGLQFSTRIQELEDDTLPLMEQLEEVSGAAEALAGELAELEPILQKLIEDEEARVAKIDAGIRSLSRARKAVAETIDATLLKHYEQVRRSRRGLGLVKIVSKQRCGGCNVKLPIYVVQKVLKGTGTTRCPSCGRILWQDE